MSTEAPAFHIAEVPKDARIGIVAARFNQKLVDELLSGCLQRLADLGISKDRIEIHRIPGAFELPLAAKAMAQTRRFAAIICLGAVVRGETPHFKYVSGEAARGIAAVGRETGIPAIFGVLTTNTEQQAWDRCGGKHGHAGQRAAEAALEMIVVLREIAKTSPGAA